MKQFLLTTSASFTLFVLPLVTRAVGLVDEEAVGGTNNEFTNLIQNLLSFVNDYLVPFVLALAFVVFIWGVFKYFVLGGSDEDKQKEGKNLIIYAVVGFVVILSLYGIVELVTDALGLGGETIDVPTVPRSI